MSLRAMDIRFERRRQRGDGQHGHGESRRPLISTAYAENARAKQADGQEGGQRLGSAKLTSSSPPLAKVDRGSIRTVSCCDYVRVDARPRAGHHPPPLHAVHAMPCPRRSGLPFRLPL